jgi:hypothetical protein
VVLEDGGLAFRCLRGTIRTRVSDVFAVVDEPADWTGRKRSTVFITARGRIEARLGKIVGIPPLVSELAARNPTMRRIGEAYDTVEPLRPDEALRARRVFNACLVLSLGWALCGVASYLARPALMSGSAIGIGLGYAAVAALAFTLVRRAVRESDGPDPLHSGLRSDDIVRNGLRAYGIAQGWAPATRAILVLLPVLPAMVHWLTMRK